MSDKLGALLIEAEAYLTTAEFTKAYNIYQQLITEYINSPEIYNNLAIAAYQLEKFQESIAYIKQAIKLDPENPFYVAQYAQFLFANDFEFADELFNDAIKLAQDTAIRTQIEYNYANLLYNQGCVTAKDLTRTKQSYAIELFTKSLMFNLNNYKAYFNIACCYINLEDTLSAIEYFKKTIAYKNDHTEAHFALSQFYQQSNNTLLAEQHLKQAIAGHCSNEANAEYNYGVLEHKKYNYRKAVEHYKKSLELNPKIFAACYNLGSIYQKLKDYNNAIKYYQEALAIKPNDSTCSYLLACLNNANNLNNLQAVPLKAPADYLEQLFDSYSVDFEHHLLNNLNYKTHELIYTLYNKNITNNNKLKLLDLGCGTGLIGPLFKSHAEIIIGIDLSQNMLDIAAEKKVYTNLIKAEINEFLENSKTTKDKFDLIILSDVLVYYGDLAILFNNIRNNLHNNNGNLLFSIELLEGLESTNNDFKLTNTGRYCHSFDYIKKVIANKFKIIDQQQVTLRTQEQHDVTGIIFLLTTEQLAP